MSAPIGVIPWIATMAVLACDVAVIFIIEQIFIDEHLFVRIQRLHFSASARTFGLDSVYRRLLLSQCSSNLHQFLALVWQLTHSLSGAETEPGDSTTLWIFSSISFFSASSFFSQSFEVPVYKLRVFLLLSYI